MVDRNIINKLGLSEQSIDDQVNEMFDANESQHLEEILQVKVDSNMPGTILKGVIAQQIGNIALIVREAKKPNVKLSNLLR